jgi:Tfp pilus assembly protein PilX
MHALTRRLRKDDGCVMVMAVLVISIVLVLGTALVASAVLTSNHGLRDRAQKSAIAAANAGLQAATYRLSNQGELHSADDPKCFTTTFVSPSGGLCPGQTDTLGNGAQYTYYVSPTFTQAENSCTGLWVVAPSGQTVKQRCVTAIGKANGVTARAQERIADLVPNATPFPVNGIWSYTTLEFTNEVTVGELELAGEIGSGKSVLFNKEIKNKGPIKILYGTTVSATCSATCTKIKLTEEQLSASPYALPAPDPEPYAKSQLSNDNSKIKFLESGGSINANREVSFSNKGTIEIPPGTYNLCSINLSGEQTIKYTPPIKLYIDSPERKTGSPESNCKAGTGFVKMTNKITWKDESASPKGSDLQFFVWGNPNATPSKSSPVFEFNNAIGGPLYADIYAPYSAVSITNTLKMVGAIAAGWVKMTNKVEFTGEGGGGVENTKLGVNFYPTAYHQCSPSYSGNPSSGCY